MTLVTTPGAANADAYVDVAGVTAVEATRSQPTTWLTLSLDQQERAIRAATVTLDRLAWRGEPVTNTQALAWPRWDTQDRTGAFLASDVIPPEVAKATATLALWIAEQSDDAMLPDETAGLSSLSLGAGVSFAFRDGRQQSPLHHAVHSLVVPLVSHLLWASGVRTVRA